MSAPSDRGPFRSGPVTEGGSASALGEGPPAPAGGVEGSRGTTEERAARYVRTLNGPGAVLVAHDGGPGSDEAARRLARSVASEGRDAVELGVASSPCLRYNVRATSALAGLRVRNPLLSAEMGDLQIVGPGGVDPDPGALDLFEAGAARSGPEVVRGKPIGTIREDAEAVARYAGSLLTDTERARVRAVRPRVVLGRGPGPRTSGFGPILSMLGCEVTTWNDPGPVTSAVPGTTVAGSRLAELKRAVVETGAWIGLREDRDGERLAITDERGENVPGSVALALFARSVMERYPGATIVASVEASSAVEEVVRSAGGTLVLAASDEGSMARELVRTGARFGGDEDGGYYWPDHLVAPDGLRSALEMVQWIASRGRPLSELAAEVSNYARCTGSVAVPPATRATLMSHLRRMLAQGAERVVEVDGIKAFYTDGWVRVSASGDDPSCRIVSESRSPDRAAALLERAVTLVNDLVRALDSGDSLGNLWCDSA